MCQTGTFHLFIIDKLLVILCIQEKGSEEKIERKIAKEDT